VASFEVRGEVGAASEEDARLHEAPGGRVLAAGDWVRGGMHTGYLERQGENDGILNAFTVDVEDYFQVGALKRYVLVEDWERFSPRV